MIPKNREKLAHRVITAAEAALAANGVVSPIDVLVGIGWTDPGTVKRWRQGQIDYLEQVVNTNLPRLSEAMKIFREWCNQRGLHMSPTRYTAESPGRQPLRFSKSGDPGIERWYSTHWISPALSEKKRATVARKGSAPPDLVVVNPIKPGWKCHRCGGTVSLLIMENEGPACLTCTGLGGLEYLPSGNALVTRRASAKSSRRAVVVRFSRTRKRYERQGMLIEPSALAEALREINDEAR